MVMRVTLKRNRQLKTLSIDMTEAYLQIARSADENDRQVLDRLREKHRRGEREFHFIHE